MRWRVRDAKKGCIHNESRVWMQMKWCFAYHQITDVITVEKRLDYIFEKSQRLYLCLAFSLLILFFFKFRFCFNITDHAFESKWTIINWIFFPSSKIIMTRRIAQEQKLRNIFGRSFDLDSFPYAKFGSILVEHKFLIDTTVCHNRINL